MNVTVKRVRLLDGANSSVVKAKASAGKGSCPVCSVFDPRSNHIFFKPKLIRKGLRHKNKQHLTNREVELKRFYMPKIANVKPEQHRCAPP